MPRPREHSDEELLELVGAGLAGNGRVGWTLAEVAANASVHAATLVKRFGSKRGLLVALSRRWLAGLTAHPFTTDPVAELLGWLREAAGSRPNRQQAIADMAMLMEDLVDGELSALLVRGWEIQMAYLAALVADAQARGLFTRAPEPVVASVAILDMVNGGAMRAAAYPSVGTWDARTVASAMLESWR
jgi:AcrR family transcriptional regulator